MAVCASLNDSNWALPQMRQSTLSRLSDVRNLEPVELHGGTIEAFSAGTGMGSEVTVRLPLAKAPAAKPTGPFAESKKVLQEAAATASNMVASAKAALRNHARVLIIDDNADSAHSMRMMLEVAGHEVEVASDGADAARPPRADATQATRAASAERGAPRSCVQGARS